MSVMRKRTSQGHAFRLTEFWSKEFDLVVKANKNAKKKIIKIKLSEKKL